MPSAWTPTLHSLKISRETDRLRAPTPGASSRRATRRTTQPWVDLKLTLNHKGKGSGDLA
jgi:hypothetical protein